MRTGSEDRHRDASEAGNRNGSENWNMLRDNKNEHKDMRNSDDDT